MGDQLLNVFQHSDGNLLFELNVTHTKETDVSLFKFRDKTKKLKEIYKNMKEIIE